MMEKITGRKFGKMNFDDFLNTIKFKEK